MTNTPEFESRGDLVKPLRQVVVADDGAGRAVIAHDGPAVIRNVFEKTPGMEVDRLWESAAGAEVPASTDAGTPTASTILPAAGETRFYVLTLPPDSVVESPDFDAAGAAAEHAAVMGAFVEAFEADGHGAHTTDTIDYVVVIDGPVWLEVDDGEATELQSSDLVVLTGNRHAWRNRTDHQVRLASVLVGARRLQAN